jgi:hypothetical protein
MLLRAEKYWFTGMDGITFYTVWGQQPATVWRDIRSVRGFARRTIFLMDHSSL